MGKIGIGVAAALLAIVVGGGSGLGQAVMTLRPGFGFGTAGSATQAGQSGAFVGGQNLATLIITLTGPEGPAHGGGSHRTDRRERQRGQGRAGRVLNQKRAEPGAWLGALPCSRGGP